MYLTIIIEILKTYNSDNCFCSTLENTEQELDKYRPCIYLKFTRIAGKRAAARLSCLNMTYPCYSFKSTNDLYSYCTHLTLSYS